jgi:hydroxymethylpyrimidine/phosphomethylpyrimidine kinase
MTAISALTAQNTQKVYNIQQTPVDFFTQTLEVVLDDIEPDAIKSGMLGSAEHVSALAKVLGSREKRYRIIVDPVSPCGGKAETCSHDNWRILAIHSWFAMRM